MMDSWLYSWGIIQEGCSFGAAWSDWWMRSSVNSFTLIFQFQTVTMDLQTNWQRLTDQLLYFIITNIKYEMMHFVFVSESDPVEVLGNIGRSVSLPCNTTTTSTKTVTLVMWFKGENEDPIYSLDLRNVQVRFIQVYCDYKDQNWLCTLDEIYFHLTKEILKKYKWFLDCLTQNTKNTFPISRFLLNQFSISC